MFVCLYDNGVDGCFFDIKEDHGKLKLYLPDCEVKCDFCKLVMRDLKTLLYTTEPTFYKDYSPIDEYFTTINLFNDKRPYWYFQSPSFYLHLSWNAMIKNFKRYYCSWIYQSCSEIFLFQTTGSISDIADILNTGCSNGCILGYNIGTPFILYKLDHSLCMKLLGKPCQAFISKIKNGLIEKFTV